MSDVTAVYPGTFDPVTNGHLDVAVRARNLFDRLVVAVYAGDGKPVTFDINDRISMFRTAIEAEGLDIDVQPYYGLTVDFARSTGASAIVRGLRISSDFEHEGSLALMNRHLDAEIETVCLFSSIDQQYVSSSRVKEIASLGGDFSTLVPANVAGPLRQTWPTSQTH